MDLEYNALLTRNQDGTYACIVDPKEAGINPFSLIGYLELEAIGKRVIPGALYNTALVNVRTGAAQVNTNYYFTYEVQPRWFTREWNNWYVKYLQIGTSRIEFSEPGNCIGALGFEVDVDSMDLKVVKIQPESTSVSFRKIGKEGLKALGIPFILKNTKPTLIFGYFLGKRLHWTCVSQDIPESLKNHLLRDISAKYDAKKQAEEARQAAERERIKAITAEREAEGIRARQGLRPRTEGEIIQEVLRQTQEHFQNRLIYPSDSTLMDITQFIRDQLPASIPWDSVDVNVEQGRVTVTVPQDATINRIETTYRVR